MANPAVILAGRAARLASRLRGSSGSAFPGMVVERLDPGFMARELEQLPLGVILVSGTNGKTTTTRILAHLLAGQGLRVFTNRTGSNFTRGVVSALISAADWRGRLDADIAVLELDEAYAVHFVEHVQPRVSVLLNVMRDQLDRFGEIDTTARLLATVAGATTETVVLNREDSRLRSVGELLQPDTVRWFGFSDELAGLFPDDDALHAAPGSSQLASQRVVPPSDRPAADVMLEALAGRDAVYRYDGTEHRVRLSLSGIHNAFNAAAAVAGVRAVLGARVDSERLDSDLATVTAAFGRGEALQVGGHPLVLSLVKNPAGFRLSLLSAAEDAAAGDVADEAVLIAINDEYADGRDMSWLWDVDFSSLRERGVVGVTGVRAADMALRLRYDEVPLEWAQPDLHRALDRFLAEHPQQPKRVFCTYTAMLALRRLLADRAVVQEVTVS